MLPAWKESDVIEHMLEHNIGRIDYDRDHYDIFCGTYQNDPETQACVDAAARRFANVHKVVVPHDGPTSKADCLNWVYQGIVLHERQCGQRFDILLMHDAEDVIHPLALRLYCLLIPPNEFVQTPVFSLPLPKRRYVSATYIDEFAEHHLKDMRVREAIGGLIPSAGVGSAFARDALEEVAAAHAQRPFNVESLTEDYEIGLKFRLANRPTHFACRTIERRVDGRTEEEFIATREFFPDGFHASVRQRSRWILGITLQTWAQIGWCGTLPVLYCLWRDRRALFTNTLLLIAYMLLLYVGCRIVVAHVTGNPWSIEAVVPAHSVLAWMLAVNFACAGWRAVMKARLVGRLYGPGHALLCVPRLVVGNVIGILAMLRAISQYADHRLTGRPLRWLKTAHAFPTPEGLAAARRRLGEYLLERQALSEAELEEALALHRATGARLGDVLRRAGIVSPSAVVEALGRQLDVRIAEPDPCAIPLPLLRRFPEAIAEELDALPLDERNGGVVVAVSEPLDAATRRRLEDAIGARVDERLSSRDTIHRARNQAYRRLVHEQDTDDVSPPVASQRLSGEGELAASRAGAHRAAMVRLGLGFCAFYGVVPVTTAEGSAPRVLCSASLHWSVRETIARRLGPATELVRAAPATVRLLLAMTEGAAPGSDHAVDAFGLDAAEWRAALTELSPHFDLEHHAREARAMGLSPLDYLEAIKAAQPAELARARARAFGLPLCASGAPSAAGLLPPSIAHAHDVTVLAQMNESVNLASPRPTPRLAHRVASLLSPLKVAWSVVPCERS